MNCSVIPFSPIRSHIPETSASNDQISDSDSTTEIFSKVDSIVTLIENNLRRPAVNADVISELNGKIEDLIKSLHLCFTSSNPISDCNILSQLSSSIIDDLYHLTGKMQACKSPKDVFDLGIMTVYLKESISHIVAATINSLQEEFLEDTEDSCESRVLMYLDFECPNNTTTLKRIQEALQDEMSLEDLDKTLEYLNAICLVDLTVSSNEEAIINLTSDGKKICAELESELLASLTEDN